MAHYPGIRRWMLGNVLFVISFTVLVLFVGLLMLNNFHSITVAPQERLGMNRPQLQEAITDLEYLTVNHPDKKRVAIYRRELERFREQLRRLEEQETVRQSGSVKDAA